MNFLVLKTTKIWCKKIILFFRHAKNVEEELKLLKYRKHSGMAKLLMTICFFDWLVMLIAIMLRKSWSNRWAIAPMHAALFLKKYGCGMVEAVTIFYDTPRAADFIYEVLDLETFKITP